MRPPILHQKSGLSREGGHLKGVPLYSSSKKSIQLYSDLHQVAFPERVASQKGFHCIVL